MAISTIPTEKPVPGKTLTVEFLVNTIADGKDFFQGQQGVISYEAFVTLRTLGFIRLAPEKPVEKPPAIPAELPDGDSRKAKTGKK